MFVKLQHIVPTTTFLIKKWKIDKWSNPTLYAHMQVVERQKRNLCQADFPLTLRFSRSIESNWASIDYIHWLILFITNVIPGFCTLHFLTFLSNSILHNTHKFNGDILN